MLVNVAQRKTSGSKRTPSCIFLMLLLEKRERPVGLRLVSLGVLVENSLASIA